MLKLTLVCYDSRGSSVWVGQWQLEKKAAMRKQSKETGRSKTLILRRLSLEIVSKHIASKIFLQVQVAIQNIHPGEIELGVLIVGMGDTGTGFSPTPT